MTANRLADRRDKRRDTIIRAARELFLENGYSATSMSAIACALGGSKTTLWTHFASKDDLFAAVLTAEIEQFQAEFLAPLGDRLGLNVTLERFGCLWLARITSPEALRLQRIITAEADRFPEIPKRFFERGPREVEIRLAAYLQAAMVSGELRQADPGVAAQHFMHLCMARNYLRRLWNVEGEPDEHAGSDDVQLALETFMRAYAANR